MMIKRLGWLLECQLPDTIAKERILFPTPCYKLFKTFEWSPGKEVLVYKFAESRGKQRGHHRQARRGSQSAKVKVRKDMGFISSVLRYQDTA